MVREEKSIMEQKLLRDYLQADTLDNMIISMQINLSAGVKILTNYIKKIFNDFKLLDDEAYEQLKKQIEIIKNESDTNKQKIIKRYDEKNNVDAYDEENRRVELYNEDHESLQKTLIFIAEIMYRKGWLE